MEIDADLIFVLREECVKLSRFTLTFIDQFILMGGVYVLTIWPETVTCATDCNITGQ